MAFLDGQQALRKSLATSVWTDKDEIRAGVYNQLKEPVLPCNTHPRSREGNAQGNLVATWLCQRVAAIKVSRYCRLLPLWSASSYMQADAPLRPSLTVVHLPIPDRE